ncbi:Glycosyltransferase involved in cell wall bisynthesis [Mucilaginibacter gossypiicola]|uniref:Glycosyltransferase involved in cell wall bisynthesis n=1 Tax=Mucilaginibacter gossypiicola TaxID=551995 RepID=A0A1H8GRG2_9SPHI|nr:glycosyltransferase [Mucilaginibacter gossypiicola]SEN46435.1 Glycosyltransferase involved in cell wall bisynthesis [Mucilaginibacter gossypiicola]
MQNTKPKLLFVSITDKANGAENILLQAARASSASLLFLKKVDNGGLNLPDDLHVEYVSTGSILSGFWGLIKSLSNYRTDHIVFSTHPYLNAYLGFLKRIGYLKSKLIVRECSSVLTRYSGLKKLSYQIAYWLGYPGVNLVVCQTCSMRDVFVQHLPYIDKQKVIIQKNPIDIEQNLIKAEAPLPVADKGAEFICAAGRLIPEKGFDLLIMAFDEIKSSRPNLKLFIFGEGPEQITLENLIGELKLTDRVILKGWIANPMPFFKHAKACVVSSIKEGFPNVLLQMMILNPVVISTNCAGGIDEIPGIYLAEADNVNSLTTAINNALNAKKHNKDLIMQYVEDRTPEIFIKSILNALV